jgi:sulfatase maturation enzyme AslB (radical SAM superfamily)
MTPDDVPAGGLELFITPTCNQKCEYCYLQRHINDLYPKENNNRETIIKNFKHVLDWCVEEDFNLPNLDLYSGEIWHTSFGLELLDIAFDYIANKGLRCNKVSIPTNATFLENKL